MLSYGSHHKALLASKGTSEPGSESPAARAGRCAALPGREATSTAAGQAPAHRAARPGTISCPRPEYGEAAPAEAGLAVAGQQEIWSGRGPAVWLRARPRGAGSRGRRRNPRSAAGRADETAIGGAYWWRTDAGGGL